MIWGVARWLGFFAVFRAFLGCMILSPVKVLLPRAHDTLFMITIDSHSTC